MLNNNTLIHEGRKLGIKELTILYLILLLSRAIDKAKGKANKFLPVWIDDHPDCWKSDSPYHTEWMNVVTIRFGDGDPKFNEKNTKKILKNIAAEVLIDKERAMIDEE